MKTKNQLVRSFLPLLAAGLALLSVGCAGLQQERFYSITQNADGKFYAPNGEQRFPSALSIKVENTTDNTIAVFTREDRVIVLVPPHQLRTIEADLDYNQENYRFILFAKIAGDEMKGKELAKREFVFRNYRQYDQVYGSGWGPVVPETKFWVIGIADFRLQDDSQGIFAPRRPNGSFNWFR
ncbi:MAG: hypothetical protein WCO79_00080 [bacterium]